MHIGIFLRIFYLIGWVPFERRTQYTSDEVSLNFGTKDIFFVKHDTLVWKEKF